MKSILRPTTPVVLVVVAIPVLFLLAPDGIPFVHAACITNAEGTVQNLALNVNRNCSQQYGLYDRITINSYSLTSSSQYCMITAVIDLTIESIDSCNATWATFCNNGLNVDTCASETALNGPAADEISYSVSCDGDGELMILQLRKGSNCDCLVDPSTPVIFEAVGTCDR